MLLCQLPTSIFDLTALKTLLATVLFAEHRTHPLSRTAFTYRMKSVVLQPKVMLPILTRHLQQPAAECIHIHYCLSTSCVPPKAVASVDRFPHR